jgi:glycosyltransferase
MRNGGMSNASLTKRLHANRRDYLALKRNGVPIPFFASVVKPLRKIPQFLNLSGQRNKPVEIIPVRPVTA